MTVTWSPTNRKCSSAWPGYRGAPVRRDALDMHISCDGTFGSTMEGDGRVFGPDYPCQCECHAPEGLPDWMRPQTGQALDDAVALERKIREDAAALERDYPVLPAGRLADIAAAIMLDQDGGTP